MSRVRIKREQLRYRSLFCAHRSRPSSQSGRTLTQEAESDYARVLYSPAFRRLQLKAQVFPLEDNASVRSRLTHSLEVAHIGHQIASIVSQELGLDDVIGVAFCTFVETACLCHDIGNPPFGHFGETAIQDWFAKNLADFKRLVNPAEEHEFLSELYPDFLGFDGNPQGFRIVSRLARADHEFGLNLTSTQLLSNLKYTVPPYLRNKDVKFAKKAGFFVSEEARVGAAREAIGLEDTARHPASLIMEAADDIAYCMSDIEDAVEKRIVKPLDLFDWIRDRFKAKDAHPRLAELVRRVSGKSKPTLLDFKARFSNLAVELTARAYVGNHESVLFGHQARPLVSEVAGLDAFLKCLGDFSRAHVYCSRDAEHLELMGYRMIQEILTSLSPLVTCKESEFLATEGQPPLLRRLKNGSLGLGVGEERGVVGLNVG